MKWRVEVEIVEGALEARIPYEVTASEVSNLLFNLDVPDTV